MLVKKITLGIAVNALSLFVTMAELFIRFVTVFLGLFINLINNIFRRK